MTRMQLALVIVVAAIGVLFICSCSWLVVHDGTTPTPPTPTTTRRP